MEPVTPDQLREAADSDPWKVVDAPDGQPVIVSDPRCKLLRAAADRIEELTDKLNKAEQACKFFLDWQDREHAWVHRLEDVIAEERGRVEELEREIAEYWEPLREGLER